MVFSSFVFLLGFLPIVLILYSICPKRAKNGLLFLASLFFYAWGEPIYVTILLFSTVFDYINGQLIGKFQREGRDRAAKVTLIIDMCGNLAILGFFKYTDFILGSINAVTGLDIPLLGIPLPIGVSFFTFQTMSYTIDVYRGIVPPQNNIVNFGTYVSLFPQLIAGPIVQYKTIGEELNDRSVSVDDFADGAYRFVVGLAKKVLLANQIGALFTEISSDMASLSVAGAWLGAIAYSFQIYYDFSGYSDMAIGLGRMFGFHFLENFDHPYISKSITEFWRRWHISLGSWFREYVYIPLGGNRRGLGRQVFNLFVVWMLTGLWHGANWNFVLWGLYYGVLLMLEKMVLLKFLKKAPSVVTHFYTLFLVVIGWTIFSMTDFSQMGHYLSAMFGVGVPLITTSVLYQLKTHAVLLVILIIASMEWHMPKKLLPLRPAILIVLFVLSFAFLVADTYNPFLYFRF